MGLALFLATTVGKITATVTVIALGLGLTGVGLYASDYAVQATVTDKTCGGSPSVTATERFTRFQHTQPIDATQCLVVQLGNFVLYNIQSERLRVYTAEGGDLIWDSEWLGSGGDGSGGAGRPLPFVGTS